MKQTCVTETPMRDRAIDDLPEGVRQRIERVAGEDRLAVVRLPFGLALRIEEGGGEAGQEVLWERTVRKLLVEDHLL